MVGLGETEVEVLIAELTELVTKEIVELLVLRVLVVSVAVLTAWSISTAMVGVRICDRVPLVPSTWTVNAPIEAVGDALTIRRVVLVSLGIGVIGDEICRVTPAGGVPLHDGDKVTGDMNPSRETMTTVVDALCPCVNLRLEADSSVKSGEGVVEVVLLVVV